MEFAIETPKLDSVVASEETMEVKEVIPTIVVVCIPASVITLVPYVGKLSQSLRMFFIDVSNQMLIHLLAEPHPLLLDFKSLIKKVVLASDDVDEVPNGPYVMVSAI